MSKEKQIEEMVDIYEAARLKARETLGSMNEGEAMWYSKAFYEAGCRKQSEWISVEERLPEREGTYLVYTYKGAIKFGDFRCYYAENDSPQFDYYVTHWMPLPEAPEGGE